MYNLLGQSFEVFWEFSSKYVKYKDYRDLPEGKCIKMDNRTDSKTDLSQNLYTASHLLNRVLKLHSLVFVMSSSSGNAVPLATPN